MIDFEDQPGSVRDHLVLPTSPTTALGDELSDYRDRSDLPDAPGFSLCVTLTGHSDTVGSVKFSGDGRKIASGSADSTAKVWDVEKHTILRSMTQPTQHGIAGVDWNWDGVTLATASDDSMARLWDTRSKDGCIRTLKGHTHHVTSCSFAPSGNMVATASFDETVRLWDVRNDGCLGVIPAHSDPVMSVCFSGGPVRPVLVTSSLDGTCRLWSSHTKECLRTFVADEDKTPMVCASFTPNNHYILVSTLKSSILLFDPNVDKNNEEKEDNENPKRLPILKKTYEGHLNTKYGLRSTFMTKTSDNSKFVVSGSEDHHGYVWSLNTRECLGVLRGKGSTEESGTGHCDAVMGIDASSVSAHVVTSGSSADCTVKLWKHSSISS